MITLITVRSETENRTIALHRETEMSEEREKRDFNHKVEFQNRELVVSTTARRGIFLSSLREKNVYPCYFYYH